MKKLYILSFLVATSAMVACNDFLDTLPDNRTEINNTEKVAKLISSSYPKASYAATLNSRVDFVSDKGTGFTENESNSDPFFWRDVRSSSQDTPEYIWQKLYLSIGQVNHALAIVTDADVETRPYIAEGKLIRAFSHFLLVNLFAKHYQIDGANASPGIPYVVDVEETVYKKYERGTVASVYTQIEKDMLQGLEKMGNDGVHHAPRFHFTRAAAYAFASRFYLYTGKWDKVIDYVNRVVPLPTLFIANGNVAAADPANVFAQTNFQPWKTRYANAASSDDVKRYYTSSSNPSNLLITEMSSRMSRYANTWRYGTKKVDTDATVGTVGGNATGGQWHYKVMSSGDNYYVPKYYELFVKEDINASSGTIYTIFPYFRNEEMLLNRAEAFAMKDDLISAIADLNVFCRQRIKSSSDLNYSETNHVLNETKLVNFYREQINAQEHFMNLYNPFDCQSWSIAKRAVILAILDFRRNEFMWEGLRYWDMIRYRIPVTHATYQGVTNTLYPEDDRWVLQIPESAILAGLELNPRTNLLSRKW